MAEDNVDYTTYADKPATDLQERFSEWLLEQTGYDPTSAKSKGAAFDAGVRLGVALRIPFQKSDANQNYRASQAGKREAAAAEPKPAKAAKAAKVEAPVEAPKAKKGKKVAAAVVEAPVETETVAETKPAKRGPRKASASKVAPF